VLHRVTAIDALARFLAIPFSVVTRQVLSTRPKVRSSDLESFYIEYKGWIMLGQTASSASKQQVLSDLAVNVELCRKLRTMLTAYARAGVCVLNSHSSAVHDVQQNY